MSPHRKRTLEMLGDVIVPMLLVVLIPVFIAFYVYDHNAKTRQYTASVLACQRGNLLRSRLNDRDERNRRAFSTAADVMKDFGVSQAAARLEDVLNAAAEAVVPVPLTDCAAVFDRPRWLWQ